MSEKKLATEANGKKMSMRLLVPLDRFTGYDHDLVKALFFGKPQTDTDAIKAHYKSSGFDPTSKIRPGLTAKLAAHPDFQDTSPAPSRWTTALLFAAGLGLHLAAVLTEKEEPGQLFAIVSLYGFVYAIGATCAWAFRKRIVGVDAHSPVFLWVPAFLFLYAWLGVRDPRPAPLWPVLGSLLLRLAVVNGVFNFAKTRNGVHRIARRKTLASAPGYFIHELAQPAPRLKDYWFPYVVAFGLTSEADDWFRVHGAAGAAGTRDSGAGAASPADPRSSVLLGLRRLVRGRQELRRSGRVGIVGGRGRRAGVGGLVPLVFERRRRRRRGRRQLGRRRGRRLVNRITPS